MSDSVRPHRQQATRLPCPWDSPGKNTGVGCHFLLQCMKLKVKGKLLSRAQTLSDPMDCSLPGSSVHGFSRQEYWSGVPLPSPWWFLVFVKTSLLSTWKVSNWIIFFQGLGMDKRWFIRQRQVISTLPLMESCWLTSALTHKVKSNIYCESS